MSVGLFFNVYYNQAVSKRKVAETSRQNKLTVNIMLRVITLNWPEDSE